MFNRYLSPPLRISRRRGNPAVSVPRRTSGQSATELVLLMPLFVVLAGGVIYTAYICFQGIKVQQTANYAARIQGQERISGRGSVGSIQQDNGLGLGYGDTAPDLNANANATSGQMGGHQGQAPPPSSVYGRFYAAVRGMFGQGVQAKLYIPPPVTGLNTDTVEVIRVLNPPEFFNIKFKPIALEAKAYGGEDPHMYALPRWGRSSNSNTPFYTTVIQNPQNQ